MKLRVPVPSHLRVNPVPRHIEVMRVNADRSVDAIVDGYGLHLSLSRLEECMRGGSIIVATNP